MPFGPTLCCAMMACAAPADEFKTVAEAGNWQSTATYAEVVGFLERLQRRSSVMHLGSLGTTFEGRSIPLVVLADPPVHTAAEARAGGKVVVFAMGNIHAGEVCGKEALLMLARELALEPGPPLLEKLVVVLAPIYNADGNDRMSPDNRPGQVGPVLGMGVRANAQGLDLNRDHVKLESPEAVGLVRFLTEWDPHLTIDTHTTNGSRHRYTLTYAAPLNPSGPRGPIEFVRDEMLPEVTRLLRERTGYDTNVYGNFDADLTEWRTYSPLPRFGGPYRGLRGQMSVLSEAYAYASYRDRVHATLEFVREILRFAAAHDDRIIEVAAQARRETIEAGRTPQPDDTVGIRHRPAAFDRPVMIKGFLPDAADIPQDHRVLHVGRFEPTRSVRRPWAYLLDDALAGVIENLRNHGIDVEPFSGSASVEVYTVTGIRRADDPFQGHRLVTLEAHASIERRTFGHGTMMVRTAQALGTLAVYLLEPESQDGLATWGFFDGMLAAGREFPVLRIRSAADVQE
ncbi:MAG: M14 family metallopeptidase [Planctomycetes bacterium]|nr:M14 family metallopeptidase [Planctomycetota bacterium]